MAFPGFGRRRYNRTDILLGLAGMLLAGASIAFPWHVYLHPEDYSPPRIAFSGNWNPGVPEEKPPAILAPVPTAPSIIPAPAVPDPVITASTPRDAAKRPRIVPLDEQPSPVAGGDYGVIFVINRTALMSDRSGVFFVEIGQKLPDGSTVTGVEETPDGGAVHTSYDRVYSPRG